MSKCVSPWLIIVLYFSTTFSAGGPPQSVCVCVLATVTLLQLSITNDVNHTLFMTNLPENHLLPLKSSAVLGILVIYGPHVTLLHYISINTLQHCFNVLTKLCLVLFLLCAPVSFSGFLASSVHGSMLLTLLARPACPWARKMLFLEQDWSGISKKQYTIMEVCLASIHRCDKMKLKIYFI